MTTNQLLAPTHNREQHFAEPDVAYELQQITQDYRAGVAESASLAPLEELIGFSAEKASDTDIVPLVELGTGTIHGTQAAAALIASRREKLRPQVPKNNPRLQAQISGELEASVQSVIANEIYERVVSEIDTPRGLSLETCKKIERYNPSSQEQLLSLTGRLLDAYITSHQNGNADSVTKQLAVAFGYIGGDAQITQRSVVGSKRTTPLDEYKAKLIGEKWLDFSDQAANSGYAATTKAEDALRALSDIAKDEFNMTIKVESVPTKAARVASTSGKVAIKVGNRAKELPDNLPSKQKTAAAVAVVGIAATLAQAPQSAQAEAPSKQDNNNVLVINQSPVFSPPTINTKNIEATSFANTSMNYNFEVRILSPATEKALQSIIDRGGAWENRGKAVKFFMEHGWTLAQAAGAVGNFMVESKMPGSDIDVNPLARQYPSEIGRGIVQWTDGSKTASQKPDRWQDALAFAQANNLDINDLYTQLKFILYEMNTTETAAKHAFMATTTVDDATKAFLTEYERAGDPHGAVRLKGAHSVFDTISIAIADFSNQGPSVPVPSVIPVLPPPAELQPPEVTSNVNESGGIVINVAAAPMTLPPNADVLPPAIENVTSEVPVPVTTSEPIAPVPQASNNNTLPPAEAAPTDPAEQLPVAPNTDNSQPVAPDNSASVVPSPDAIPVPPSIAPENAAPVQVAPSEQPPQVPQASQPQPATQPQPVPSSPDTNNPPVVDPNTVGIVVSTPSIPVAPVAPSPTPEATATTSSQTPDAAPAPTADSSPAPTPPTAPETTPPAPVNANLATDIANLKASGQFDKSQALPDAPRAPLKEMLKRAGEQNGKLTDLVDLGPQWPNMQLVKPAAAAFEQLNAAFKAQFGRRIKLKSTYRSYEGQVATKEDAVSKGRGELAATPGHSIHGWGLAIDMGGGMQSFGSAEYQWMLDNAINYGWVHPAFAAPGTNAPEPWHWEFEGTTR